MYIFGCTNRFCIQGNYIYPNWCWESIAKKFRIHHYKLVIQPTHGHFMAFMALKNQTIWFPNKSTPNEPSKLKKSPNFENFKFWPLFWPSKFFSAFCNFLLVLGILKVQGCAKIIFLSTISLHWLTSSEIWFGTTVIL